MTRELYTCGYAPRVLRRLPRPDGFAKVLFIGAKDGSVTVLRQPLPLPGEPTRVPQSPEERKPLFESTYLALPAAGGGRRASVRSLLEWGKDKLIVGRDDGTLDIVHWKKALESDSIYRIPKSETFAPPPVELGSGGESVRYATWIDDSQDQLLISYRYAGTRLLSGNILRALTDPARYYKPLSIDQELGGIRLAARIQGIPNSFVLIGPKGALWRWSPGFLGQAPILKSLGTWRSSFTGKDELPPTTFDDATYVGYEIAPGLKAIQALIVATDTGIFALDLREKAWRKGKPSPVRLSLPGGRFWMAVTYAQIGPEGSAHLWLTNREGESYLFENAPLEETESIRSWALRFGNSRLVHMDAQALTATSWPDGDRIWLARACRDDQIRVQSYAAVAGNIEASSMAELLSVRCKGSQLKPLLRRLRASIRNEDAGADYSTWPDYAVLAEYFESQAVKSTPEFIQFLSHPSTGVAAAILASEAKNPDRGTALETVQSAIRLWTYSLIGIVHRQSNPREEFYLGILRFLRGLAEVNFSQPALKKCLSDSVDWALRFARKWGLYGEVNEIRQNLVRPLAILRQEEILASPRRLLDRLTYSSLLFRRSYSEVFRDTRESTPGDHAWATKTLRLRFRDVSSRRSYDIDLVAVSWRRTGIAMYILDPKREEGAAFVRIHAKLPNVQPGEIGKSNPLPRHDLLETENSESSNRDDQFAYSRDILLLKRPGVPNGFFILRARRASPTSPWDRDLECWPCKLEPHLGPSGAGWILNTEAPSTLPPAGKSMRGAVYRFLSAGKIGENQRVVIALAGRYGRPEIAQIEVTPEGSLTVREFSRLLGESGSDVKSDSKAVGDDSKTKAAERQRNRTWSLARAGKGILAGSDNGEIWLVQLTLGSCTKVGQLASAVTALDARTVGGRLRIYAGARDGTVISFQEIRPRRKKDKAIKQSFATLWATVERSAISYIDHHVFGSGGGDRNEPKELVLAATQDGTCLAFDDRSQMGDFRSKESLKIEGGKIHPQQPPFPGIRWLRTVLGRTCFAAVSIPNRLNSEADAWRLLATATGEGGLDLLSLHYPRYTKQRTEEFKRHFDDLWSVACDETGSPRYLRVVDATYRSAPLIPLLIVRLILDPDPVRGRHNLDRLGKLECLRRWWMPKFLRPLLDMHNSLKLASDFSLPEITFNNACKNATGALETLLDIAWKRSDVDLFQEITALVLKRMNFMLFEFEGRADVSPLKNLYFSLFETIEAALQKWLGSDSFKEARARIIVAKNLVDGDTAHHLFDILQSSDHDDNRSLWREILNKRIEGVRQLVWKGDPIVSLESLRAANHSLLRICRRLSDEREKDGTGLIAVRWEYFKDYFEQLLSGAVQALGPNLRLRDALTHEYARTFALCLSACPEGAVRMIGRLTDVRLIVDPRSEDDLVVRIEDQISLLDDACRISFHPWIKALFNCAYLKPNLRPELKVDRSTLDLDLPSLRFDWCTRSIDLLKDDLNEVNALYHVIHSIDQIAADLAGGSSRHGSESEQSIEALAEIARVREGSEIYLHSWKFWNDALHDRKLKKLDVSPLRGRIRPDAVHSTRKLGDWAKKWTERLNERYNEFQIFQPEYGLYKELLDLLGRAAENFPQGAAVQTNLVLGILGHHLLEDLDLHVLELREIARNLDPIVVDAEIQERFRSDDSDKQPKSAESKFANLLIRRAEKARGLPKSLRSLAKVLNPSGSSDELGKELKSLRRHVQEAFGPKGGQPLSGEERDRGIDPLEGELLSLIFDELLQNHHYHSGFTSDELEGKPPLVSWRGKKLTIQFPVSRRTKDDTERWTRLRKVCKGRGESPREPASSGDVPSSGVGLYLSCLAASMVGWKIRLSTEAGERSSEGSFAVSLEPPLQWQPPHEDSYQEQRDLGTRISFGRRGHVVIVDDKVEVALFVWRELGQVPGFGSASVTAEQTVETFGTNALMEFSEENCSPKYLETPGAEAAIWWVRADGNALGRLSKVLDAIPRSESVCFLIDVRGPVANWQEEEREQPQYSWRDVVIRIRLQGRPASLTQIQLISSYEHGVKRFKFDNDGPALRLPIHDKSPKTFSELRAGLFRPLYVAHARNDSRLPNPTELAANDIHILITGAGFELKDQPEELRLGTLKTWEVLQKWASECFPKAKGGWSPALKKDGTSGYPIPTLWKDKTKLLEAAAAEKLDWYLSLMLEAERSFLTSDLEREAREYEIRGLFREAFVQDDWGYLRQALSAASLPWGAWLSTNYTRFADRAIERIRRLEEPHRINWRTIEVSEEAERLSLEILHREKMCRQFGDPTLFKLHGDLGHVLTMAIAGEDKTFLSRLHSFAPLYLAAEAFLKLRSREVNEANRVIWHIVGHGLRDDLLVRVIHRVYRSSPKRHLFVVVDPAAGAAGDQKEHPAHRLLSQLGVQPPIAARCAPAGLYLAGLKAAGLSGFLNVLAGIREPDQWDDQSPKEWREFSRGRKNH